MNCIKKPSGGCKCCCHPNHPVKEGGKVVCKEVKGLKEHKECPAYSEYNEWSKCIWYPITNVAKQANEHCNLQSVVPPSIDITKVMFHPSASVRLDQILFLGFDRSLKRGSKRSRKILTGARLSRRFRRRNVASVLSSSVAGSGRVQLHASALRFDHGALRVI